jgi:D-sedoheptulose 7-phosphate isomerase
MSKKLIFSKKYFEDIINVIKYLDHNNIEKLVDILVRVKKNKGRIFFLGVGGSAGNCSHAVNDFRKLCNIESYSPVDNVSELTARINDEGWDNSFKDWLIASKINKNDVIFIFSVGGGNKKKNVSTNLIKAIDLGKSKKSKILGIVGKTNGYLALKGDCVIKIPFINQKFLTPFAEAMQAVIWHYLVSHPRLQVKKTKW